MSRGSTFVEVPTDRFREALEALGESVKSKGGDYEWGMSGREQTFMLRLHDDRVGAVKVLTSMTPHAKSARGCGKDAVRVYAGAMVGDRFSPMKSLDLYKKTVHRTAPRAAEDRFQVFMDRVTKYVREAYKSASSVRKCPKCGKPMAKRTNKATGHEFLGCLGYPECKHTER